MLRHIVAAIVTVLVASPAAGAQAPPPAAPLAPAAVSVAPQPQAPQQPPAPPRPATPASPATPARPARPVPVQPQPPRPPEPVGQPINVRLEITITDQAGPGDPVRKVVTMLMADGQPASVRTSGRQRVPGPAINAGDFPVTINVDARPNVLRDGAIRLQLGLEYLPRPSAGQPEAAAQPLGASALNQRMNVILQDGKPLVISQASDPGSDRKISVELRATVLR